MMTHFTPEIISDNDLAPLELTITIRDDLICAANDQLSEICQKMNMKEEDALIMCGFVTTYRNILSICRIGMTPNQLEILEEFIENKIPSYV